MKAPERAEVPRQGILVRSLQIGGAENAACSSCSATRDVRREILFLPPRHGVSVIRFDEILST